MTDKNFNIIISLVMITIIVICMLNTLDVYEHIKRIVYWLFIFIYSAIICKSLLSKK